MTRKILLPLIAALLCSAQAPLPPSPQDIYGPLFEAVQAQRVFPDGKSFVDATPREAPDAIMAAYRRDAPRDKDALHAFVLRHFDVPGEAAPAQKTLTGHIRALWPQLTRPALEPAAGSSALALPAPYVVPGGRFREIYYWDSYFTMLGLKADGQDALIASMLANFESLIDRYGHIPNGTRTYYLSRSQPPFLSQMIDLAGDANPASGARHLAALRAEHRFWMAESETAQKDGAARRVVRMPDGSLLNRYWDDRDDPRDESWAEDVATARESNRPRAEIYRHLRAGAESGWDFSSRWLADPARLATIRTTDIVPIDLNSLLWAMERNIARRCRAAGDEACADDYDRASVQRERAIDRYLWVARDGRFADWDRVTGRPTAILSAATLYPLFVGMADKVQAAKVARTVRARLVASGGLRTTEIESGQQWDRPNGWAPLQWIAIAGLERYGEAQLARTIAAGWVRTVDTAFRSTGKMLEKYDVEQHRPGGGGEYPLQDGFGWTNGVTRAILERYPALTPSDNP
ncbi:alpha,alpha-trehalase TreF [Sphingobium rhizovicinum]|uniref:Alpha,alpha-trehalase TreF n=1 Tax=Sphingobium rhizovicinum TaxID=432308 RepID=A0ABV7NJ95_9SPHN